jgi:hypothetical protein
MRQITIFLGLGALLLLTGCPLFQKKTPQDIGLQVTAATPSAGELVAYLNDNARKVESLGCRNMDIDAKQDGQPVGLQGWLYCQKPKSFRMNATLAGSTELDMGSNNSEFWFWIRRADPPYLYHCSHEDFARGNVRLPFPFQPEWLMEALGIGYYDPARPYQVVANKGTIELIEQGTLPQGQRVNKVTVFSRGQNGLQVTGHILKDEQNREIATATIERSQRDAGTSAVLPKVVVLKWEAEHMNMRLRLNDLAVNRREGERNGELYARPNLKDIRPYDLAQTPANPTGQVRRLSSQPLPVR